MRGLGLAAIGTGVAVSRSTARRAEAAFREQSEIAEPVVEGLALRLPVVYHHADGFSSLHSASYRAVADSLPTDTLQPVRLRDGRAAVFIGAYHYRDYSYRDLDDAVRMGPPYGEVVVAALVTRQPLPPFVPLALGVAGLGRLEGFVLHLPVTSRLARDAGRVGWGLPKFVADMDFEDDLGARCLRLGEGDREILSLAVRSGGMHIVERQPMVLYSVKDGRLLRTSAPSIQAGSYRLGGSAGELVVGTGHPVADDLRRLEIAPRPLLTETLQTLRIILPGGVPAGDARPYAGYLGRDRAFGRFTVRYPGTGRMDVYADLSKLVADAAATLREGSPVPEHEPVPA